MAQRKKSVGRLRPHAQVILIEPIDGVGMSDAAALKDVTEMIRIDAHVPVAVISLSSLSALSVSRLLG